MSVIGFIGGTGPEGKGLAYRFALAGQDIVIGSRSADRANEAAAEVAEHSGSDLVRAAENLSAASEADIVVLTVPYTAQAGTLPALASAVADKVVVSTAVPLSFDGGKPSMLDVPEGSAAQQAQALLPGAKVVGAFQNLSAPKLWAGDTPLEQDVIVCADDAAAKETIMSFAQRIRGARAVDGGQLASSRYVEGITALLIGVNRRYKTNAGVRIVGLP